MPWVQRSFDSVLLLENLYEGLVMLRRELHWDLADMMFISARSSHSAVGRDVPISSRWF